MKGAHGISPAPPGSTTLDADEVSGMLAGMQPLDDMLRASGHYGPKVEVAVAADADEQTRLIAFTGRRP